MGNRPICLVDAYSTANALPGLFAKEGRATIHVQSDRDIAAVYTTSYRPEDFTKRLIVQDFGIASLIDTLREIGIAAVIAGCETGVALADQLACSLGLPGNDPKSSELRRNKYAMGEATRLAGLNAPKQATVSSVNEARNLATDWSIWPIVVKPQKSAGSDNVYFCYDEKDLARAVSAIIGKRNAIGGVNEGALIQERLSGQQFIVNSVSQSGFHKITEIWRDDRQEVRGAALIYDREMLLPRFGDVQSTLVSYASQALTAVGITHGAAHMEIMLTSKGPCLIEVGARVQGGIDSGAVQSAIGSNQLSDIIDLTVYPDRFARRFNEGYRIRKHLSVVSLISRRSGRVLVNKAEDILRSLPSFYSMLKIPAPGDFLKETVDLFTSPGTVYLHHDCADQLERDYRTIRNAESNGAMFLL